jgi:ferredoxin-type protein NapG
MKRRDFFKLGAQRTAQAVVGVLEEQVERRAAGWLRPPFARAELDFLLACTRCDDCIEACPHDIVFALPARLGLQVAGTPALDLSVKGCQMCADWPCVAACQTGALVLPQAAPGAPPPMPKLATARIDTNTCLPYSGPECGACAHTCPVDGALNWVGGVKPVIDEQLCTGCALCREACITEPKSVLLSAPARDEEPAEAL